MTDLLSELGLFAAKGVIITIIVLALLLGIVMILALAKEKGKAKGKLVIRNVNEKLADMKETLFAEILPKKDFKQYLKSNKAEKKAKDKAGEKRSRVFVLNFNGDIHASTVENLREEVTAILSVATNKDEVVARIDSGGGVVHGYGLAASQLMRIRAKNIPLTTTIDKVAASGGYMMACTGSKVLAAPFAIVGSIGVIVQLPNFHRVLQDKHIGFEQLTAGEYKRTITLFGENTDEGRHKLKHELEDIHLLFKNLIKENRQQIDIQRVATGEHWLGQQALGLKLVDELMTSDEYLCKRADVADVFEVTYQIKKPLFSKLGSSLGKLFYPSNSTPLMM